jgi:hypothetical protein
VSQPAYFTILARNYLPVALTLNESLRRHGDGSPLNVFLIDSTAETELPDVPGVRWMHGGMLDVEERTLLEMAAYYDLVEYATAVKPLIFQALLKDHEQVAYLDPDTYAVSPMEDLAPAVSESPGGIVLTPHYLEPVPADSQFSEGHVLHVGVYNLGFCALDRRAGGFLDWWWSHLKTECLHDPIAGLFVDQKWVDLGSVLFDATAWRHRGYNVGLGNLPERPIGRDTDGAYTAGDDPLRLFHFHAFDPEHPEALSTRFRTSHPEGYDIAALGFELEALTELCNEYAALVLAKRGELGPQPPYIYDADTNGRKITRRMRNAYRVAAMTDPGNVPSPFIPAEADAYDEWRKSARSLAGKLMASDVAKGMRFALPEEYANVRGRAPKLVASLRGRFVQGGGMWE